jgi:hypothetical protein
MDEGDWLWSRTGATLSDHSLLDGSSDWHNRNLSERRRAALMKELDG